MMNSLFARKHIKKPGKASPEEPQPVKNLHPNDDDADIYVSVEHLLGLRHLANTIDLSTKRRSTSSIDGSSRSSFRGRGMEFSEVRPYNSGDDIRNIDWRVTARTQQTYTKLFQEEKERPVYIVVDQRSTMFFGSQGRFKSAFAAQVAAIIGWAALKNNDRIGALVFGDNQQIDLRAKRGKHALLQFIYQLQQYNHTLQKPISTNKHLSLHEILNDIRRVAKPGSAIFVISDCSDFDSRCEEPLGIASRHADVHLIRIYDALEKMLPAFNNLMVTNGENKTDLGNINSTDYTLEFNKVNTHIENFCLNRKIMFTSVVNTTQLSDLISMLFAQKRHAHKSGGR